MTGSAQDPLAHPATLVPDTKTGIVLEKACPAHDASWTFRFIIFPT